MVTKKTKTIRNLEERMDNLSPDSLRYRVLESAKDFKTSWIELGQILYAVWKDKLYKDWGYNEFEAFASKEIGVQKLTALKLLRSYSFLENKEPKYLKKDHNQQVSAKQVPTYEAVDVLRRANSNKDIDQTDYSLIRKYVLEDGKDAKEVRKDLTQIMKKNEDLAPEEIYEKKRKTKLKRFISLLRSLKEEISSSSDFPKEIISQIETLINSVESEIS